MSVVLLFAAVLGLIVVLCWPVRRVRRPPLILLERADPNAPAEEPDRAQEASQQALFFYLLGQITHHGRSEDRA